MWNMAEEYPDTWELLTPEEKQNVENLVKKYTETREDPDRSEIVGNVRLIWHLLQKEVERYIKRNEPAAVRRSQRYKEWRAAVFERDAYTCQICGRVGGTLNAHHIKQFSKYPELRFEVSNGATLCEDCHRLVHRKRR